jgi:predicted amidohydrolase
MPWCQSAMRVRSLENGVYAATANRVGVEERAGRPKLRFTGRSQVTDPRGEVLASAPEEGEALVTAPADPAKARDKRLPAGNDLIRDRRPERYRTIL